MNKAHSRLDRVEDPYIKGWLSMRLATCENCNKRTVTIRVGEVTLPPTIQADGRLIIVRAVGPTRDNVEFIKHIGIGCGCYALFHRQVAHILDKQRARNTTSPEYA